MWPFLKEGRDSVIVKSLPVSSMHRGDIILYRRNDQILVLHRLHHKNKKDFFLTGDNQTQIEGPVRQKEVLGVVTTILAKKTYFFKISSTLAAYKPSMAAFSSDKALYSSPIS